MADNDPVPPERRDLDIDPPEREPQGVADVKNMHTTIGAASTGVLLEEDEEQARLRLYDVQIILAELGYLAGEHGDLEPDITGVWDNDTRDAIAAFQNDHEIEETGQLDPETYEALLAEHELALQTQASDSDYDEFDPLRADQPLNPTSLAGDEGEYFGEEEED